MASQNKFLKLFETVFTVLSLFLLSNALIPLLIIRGASEGDGADIASLDYSFRAKISILIYLVSFILLILRWKKVVNVLRKDLLIWLLVIIVALSPLWSILPSETIKYSFYAIGTTAFGLYIATRYTLKEQIVIFSWTFGLIILLSLLFIVAIPQYGTMAALHEGAFRGIYTHKNQFGLVLVPAAVIFFLRAIDSKSRSWIFWLLLACTVAFTVLSRSSTSIGNLFIMLLLCIAYRVLRWRSEVMINVILGTIILGIIGILLFVNFVDTDLLLVSIGKDSTFSGRTDIWRYAWDKILESPWVGYGVAVFWQGYKGPSAYVQLALGGIEVAYAHNGFIDLWLSIGLVGLSTFVFTLLRAIAKSVSLLRKTNSPEGFWPLLFLTYILLSNISEGTITTMDNTFWAMYTGTIFSLVMVKNSQKYVSTSNLLSV